MSSYYIYYRVTDVRLAGDLVRRLQDDVRHRTGVAGRWMKKRGEPGLWMEIYEDVVDTAAFERALAQAVEDAAFGAVLAPGSARKSECFEAA